MRENKKREKTVNIWKSIVVETIIEKKKKDSFHNEVDVSVTDVTSFNQKQRILNSKIMKKKKNKNRDRKRF